MASNAELFKELRSLSFKEFKAFAQQLPEMELKTLKEKLDDAYYNTGEETIQDYKYDWLKDFIVETFPDEEVRVGAPLREGENRAKLPYWLGSMDKIYPEDTSDLTKWLSRNPATEYIVSEKLDGVSCLLIVDDGQVTLLTRGDGSIGADISYLRPFIKGIPRNLEPLEGMAFRGELIMSKDTFTKKWKEKYANPRNLVSGVVNSKSLKEAAKDVEFVAYEIVSKGENPPPSEQFAELKKLGFRTPRVTEIADIDADTLRETLIDYKTASPFEIDGIIVQSNVPYFRNNSGNPEYAFAFKMMMEDAVVETEVLRVEWNLSKRGYLKPRLELSPVSTGGVVIKFATAFNAKFIEDNKLGPGAKVLVTRSGDVIPYIVKVVLPADAPSMPDIPYVWNETHVDILAVSEDRDMCIQLIVNFFQTFGIKFVSEATVDKMFDNGFDTLYKIITADVNDLAKIEGMGLKSAQRIRGNIDVALQEVTLAKMMSASGIFGFGFGEKKFKRLLNGYPLIFSDYKKLSPQAFIANVTKIEGFSDKTAGKIREGIMPFLYFMKKVSPLIRFKKVEVANLQRFKGIKVVFTGFRDASVQEKIESEGGQVTTSVSKNTGLVVAANPNESTGKVQKARELGIKIMSRDAFMKEYFSDEKVVVKKSPEKPKLVMDKEKISPKKTTQAPLEAFLPKVEREGRKIAKSPVKAEKEQVPIDAFLEKKVRKSPVKKTELTGNIVIRRGPVDLTRKLAIFDFDSTLVKPKGGRPFPTNKDDWMWMRKSVPEVLRKLYEDGAQLVVVTNQSKNMKIEMIKEVFLQLNLPIIIIIGVDDDGKKPSTKFFLESIPGFKKEDAMFFVGDAGGRAGDWSDMDKKFADNLGVEFYVPEEIFPPDEVKEHSGDFSNAGEEVVIMVGLPAVGKSTFVQRHLSDHAILSGDVLKTDKKMVAEAERLYAAGERQFVFDATNVTPEKRAPYIEFAKKHSLPVRCIVLESPIENILERNKQRTHEEKAMVAPVAIYTLRKKFVMPEDSEGCTIVKLEV